MQWDFFKLHVLLNQQSKNKKYSIYNNIKQIKAANLYILGDGSNKCQPFLHKMIFKIAVDWFSVN